MGSYISIVNDTPDPIACSVGTDMAAVEVFGMVTGVIAALATVITTAGTAAPALTCLGATGMYTIAGISTSAAIAIAAPVAEGVATAVGVLKTVVAVSVDAAAQDGYVKIQPGEKHQFGKYSLSLWQQGHCKRYRRDESNMRMIYDEIYMRPIFSGATDGSNNDHSVQWWLDKWGAGNEAIIDIQAPDGRESWGDVNAPLQSLLVNAASQVAPSPVVVAAAHPTPAAHHVSPVAARSFTPAIGHPFAGTRSFDTPSSSPSCDLCGNGQRIALRDDITVDIPDYGTVSCAVIDAANRAGKIGDDDCPLLGEYLAPCGCPGQERTMCDFFCGSTPKNEDVIVHIPNGGGELTCREVDAINRAGRISEGVCPLVASVLGPCGCAHN